MEPGLTELEQIWSLLLLSCSLLLNLVALVVLVRWAGSCHSDPAVPPLISVTGCSLLHSVMVEIFSVQQQSLQQFNYSPRLCQVIIINHLVLMDVPFITIALLLAITLRRLSKADTNPAYSHFSVCCGQTLLISLPWLTAILTNTTINTQSVATIRSGYCIEKEPRNMAEYLIRQGIVLGLPVIITLATTIISLPGLFRCVSNTSFLLRPRADKEDLGLLSVLFTAHLIFQAPVRAFECWMTYNGEEEELDEILLLIVKCVKDLPLIINPLGILTLRSWRKTSHNQPVSDDMEENLMMISTDSKEFEEAFFKAKTTSL